MNKWSTKKLAIVITAAIVALALLILGVVALVNFIKRDAGFSYTRSNLNKYITFTSDYKNFELNIDIAKPRYDLDIDISILNMLCDDKPSKAYLKGSTANMKINPGDVVYIWYRGFLLDENGEPTIEVDGMSNFTQSSAHALEIGSNGFVPGFEYSLVGKKTGDSDKFEKITSGAVKDATVAYVSFTKQSFNADGTINKSTTSSPERIELSDEKVDEKYGEGFLEQINKLLVGVKLEEFKTKINDKDVQYTDLKVDFVTTCEKDDVPTLTVECYFPYDYSNTELRNEDAVFEVYIEKIDCYYVNTPVFDDDYLKKKIEDKDLAITLETLEEYEGESLVDKFRAYSKELLDTIYETEYKQLVEEAIWEHYSNISVVKKYPTIKVEEAYLNYENELRNLFLNNGGQIYNSYTGSYDSYTTLDTYANAYLGINSSSEYYVYGTEAWKYAILDMAESFVKERLVLFYVLRDSGIIPDKKAVAAEVEIIKQEYVEEYINQYLSNEKKTREDYTDAEWEKFKKDRTNEVLSYYDKSHFEERAYYGLTSHIIIEWPTVITLDNRRAYPVNQ